MASIAIVIVNYNGGELLQSCLRCIMDQTRPADRVIVVDNASTDNSIDALSAFPDVELCQLPSNTGFAAAANRGVALADSCDWVALVNPDAFASPGWLQAVDEAIVDNPGYKSFASRLMSHTDPNIVDGAGDAYHISGRPRRISHGKPLTNLDLQGGEVFAPCAAAGIYAREAVVHAGGFEEEFFCYLEDVDLGFRMQLLGYRCLYIPQAVVEHIGSAITGRGSDFQVYHAHRNIVWTFFRNMPLPLLIAFLPLHLAINLAAVILFTYRGQGRVIFKAKWDAMKGFRKALRKRSQTQSSRRISLNELAKVLSLVIR